MEKEQDLDFETVMLMKEKRRTSRSKGKRTYEKAKIRSSKRKHRNVKKISYIPYDEDDYYDE